eukprot:5424574-Prymnesium_polylepis.4
MRAERASRSAARHWYAHRRPTSSAQVRSRRTVSWCPHNPHACDTRPCAMRPFQCAVAGLVRSSAKHRSSWAPVHRSKH